MLLLSESGIVRNWVCAQEALSITIIIIVRFIASQLRALALCQWRQWRRTLILAKQTTPWVQRVDQGEALSLLSLGLRSCATFHGSLIMPGGIVTARSAGFSGDTSSSVSLSESVTSWGGDGEVCWVLWWYVLQCVFEWVSHFLERRLTSDDCLSCCSTRSIHVSNTETQNLRCFWGWFISFMSFSLSVLSWWRWGAWRWPVWR